MAKSALQCIQCLSSLSQISHCVCSPIHIPEMSFVYIMGCNVVYCKNVDYRKATMTLRRLHPLISATTRSSSALFRLRHALTRLQNIHEHFGFVLYRVLRNFLHITVNGNHYNQRYKCSHFCLLVIVCRCREFTIVW